MPKLACFKAYDIRGRVPDELNPVIAYRIGFAYGKYINPQKVVVGYDVRLQSPVLAAAVTQGLLDSGADVIDIGLCGTEEVYFQTFYRGVGGGIMVTASHNPMDYNGMKLVRDGSRPISGDTGLNNIRELAESITMEKFPEAIHLPKYDRETSTNQNQAFGFAEGTPFLNQVDSICAVRSLVQDSNKISYIQHLLSYIDQRVLRPLKIVANAGNGCAGPVIDLLAEHLPFDFIRVHHNPDGAFPNGIPNPLLRENRSVTANAVIEHSADLGIAWDGDFDRCFFFDENGRFIEGYYLVGLLAQILLEKNPQSAIIHDPRLTWNTIDLVTKAGGFPIQSKTGHAFIKERMRKENALYGGEMSAHHYFRDFAYCDSGMIPWLLVAERLSKTGMKLSTLVDERIREYPCSGEINFVVEDAKATLKRIREYFAPQNPDTDETDGLTLIFPGWRFNVRASNTEPLLRLNVEARGDRALLRDRTDKVARLIERK
jgi:phosphomannomutase/phosphoglucomutase